MEIPTLPITTMMSTTTSMTISLTHVASTTFTILQPVWDITPHGDGMVETAYSTQTMLTTHGFMILGMATTEAFTGLTVSLTVAGDTLVTMTLGDGTADIITTGDGAMAEALIEMDTATVTEMVIMMDHGAIAGQETGMLETAAQEVQFTLAEPVHRQV